MKGFIKTTPARQAAIEAGTDIHPFSADEIALVDSADRMASEVAHNHKTLTNRGGNLVIDQQGPIKIITFSNCYFTAGEYTLEVPASLWSDQISLYCINTVCSSSKKANIYFDDSNTILTILITTSGYYSGQYIYR